MFSFLFSFFLNCLCFYVCITTEYFKPYFHFCSGEVCFPTVAPMVLEDEQAREENNEENHQHEQQDERAEPEGEGLQESSG